MVKAIREIVRPVNKKIIISLGNDCNESDEYEVIVFPVQNKDRKKMKNKSKFLDLAGKIDIDWEAINELREKSIL
jgi:hypothetical protein